MTRMSLDMKKQKKNCSCLYRLSSDLSVFHIQHRENQGLGFKEREGGGVGGFCKISCCRLILYTKIISTLTVRLVPVFYTSFPTSIVDQVETFANFISNCGLSLKIN